MKIKTITSLILDLIFDRNLNYIRSGLRPLSEFTAKTMFIRSYLRPGPCNAGRCLDPDKVYNRNHVHRNLFLTVTLTNKLGYWPRIQFPAATMYTGFHFWPHTSATDRGVWLRIQTLCTGINFWPELCLKDWGFDPGFGFRPEPCIPESIFARNCAEQIEVLTPDSFSNPYLIYRNQFQEKNHFNLVTEKV